jgi:glycosyltransferase involved in cell wall biosynthesis
VSAPRESIILPTINEGATITPIVQQLLLLSDRWRMELIIVVVDSADGTAELVRQLAHREPEVLSPRWAAINPAYPEFAQSLSRSRPSLAAGGRAGHPGDRSGAAAAAAGRATPPALAAESGRIRRGAAVLGTAAGAADAEPTANPRSRPGHPGRIGVEDPRRLLGIGYERYSVVYYSEQPVTFFDTM